MQDANLFISQQEGDFVLSCSNCRARMTTLSQVLRSYVDTCAVSGTSLACGNALLARTAYMRLAHRS